MMSKSIHWSLGLHNGVLAWFRPTQSSLGPLNGVQVHPMETQPSLHLPKGVSA